MTSTSSAQSEPPSVKLPSFFARDVELWFGMVERAFEASSVSCELARYRSVCCALDPDYALKVKSLIVNPPAEQPYTTLKKALLRRLSIERGPSLRLQRLQEICKRERTAEQRPSQVLREIRDACLSMNYAESVLRQMWIGKLSISMKPFMLARSEEPIDKLAELADEMFDLSLSPSAQPPRSCSSAAEAPQPGSSSAEPVNNNDIEDGSPANLFLQAMNRRMQNAVFSQFSQPKHRQGLSPYSMPFFKPPSVTPSNRCVAASWGSLPPPPFSSPFSSPFSTPGWNDMMENFIKGEPTPPSDLSERIATGSTPKKTQPSGSDDDDIAI